MAFSAVTERLQELSDSLDNLMPDIIAQAVMAELMGMHKNRIFRDGLRTDGSKIGKYVKKAAYFPITDFVRTGAFKPRGKEKTGKFKNGKERKTMFFATGYSGLREAQDRDGADINLAYSFSLRDGINVLKVGNSTQYGTTDAGESIKFEGLEDRFEVFGLTVNEKDFLRDEITDQAIIVAKKK